MANTLNQLSYANTFADWVVTTNNLVRENNDIAANTYTKSNGTLLISSSGIGLQVSNNALFQGSFQVAGTGSSATIQNNATVQGQLYATNTTLGLVVTSTANTSNLNVVGPGTAMYVANNSNFGGSVTIAGNTTITNTVFVSGSTTISNSVNITGVEYVGSIKANTNIQSATFTGTGTAYVSNLRANATVFADSVEANLATITAISASTLSVSNTTNSVYVTANTLYVAVDANVQSLFANSAVTAPEAYITALQANVITANIRVNTPIANVTGTLYSNVTTSNTVTANTAVTTPLLYVSTLANVQALYSNTSIQSDTGTFRDVTISGNFIINGTTVYDTDTFTLKGGSTPLTGTQKATYAVNRQTGLSVFTPNAHIQFDNSDKLWKIRDLPGADANVYYTIVTEKYTANVNNAGIVQLSNSNTSLSITQALSLAGANTLDQYISATASSANTVIRSHANGAFDRANASSNLFTGTTGTATSSSGNITFASNNGVVVSGQANTLFVNTPQDVRTTASPTFNALTLSNALPLTQGGTGGTSSASALTNILPTGTTAGYVLTTGGPGTFYWSSANSGGGGVTPGTTINSSRLFPTVNSGQTIFSTPTYIPGASQLRVYVNGVRQFNSEYTETDANTVTLTTGSTTGDVVMLEVDGYINNPYYANNITYGPATGDIPGTANTIQLAIDSLESRKAALIGATYTGVVNGITVDANSSNTAFATTLFVKNVLGSGNTFAINAATVTNGVVTTGSYADPSWITSLANTKISGLITASQIDTVANTQITGRVTSNQIANTGVTATGYGSASSVPTFTVDLQGRITTAANVAIAISSGSVSGLAASATTDTTNASNIGSGTLASARLGTTGTPQFASTQISSLGVGTAASGTTGEIRATNNITAYYSSDKKFKENISNIPDALNKVNQIGGKIFDWKDEYIQQHGGIDDYFMRKKDFGVIAQDVESVFPLAVRTRPDGSLAVDYEKLCSLAFAAIKELKAEVDALKGNNK